MKRILWISLVGLLMIPVLAAEAHAELVKASPSPGSVVTSDVSEIRLTFDEAIEEGSSITLFAEGFRVIPGIRPQLQDADMFAVIPTELDPGVYTVQWAAIGDDGHTTQGSYQFTLADTPSRATWLWWLLIVPIAAVGYLIWRRSRERPA